MRDYICFVLSGITCEIVGSTVVSTPITIVDTTSSDVTSITDDITTARTTSTTTDDTTTTTSTATAFLSTTYLVVENPVAIYNTKVGGTSTEATAGSLFNEYPSSYNPSKLFDKDLSTSHRFRVALNVDSSELGVGFYLTTVRGPFILAAVRFATSKSSEQRDPTIFTIEGSNETSKKMLQQGSSWQLLYNGSTGLEAVTERGHYGEIQVINSIHIFCSFRVLVMKKRQSGQYIEYSEVELLS
ncbi:hypothetical protein I4U23_012515 [Adineta vaga]|nr:hypothetical protein I4U23_012515 [Adineta vaga]